MKDTAAESAELKQALKHDPVTDALEAEARAFPLEAEEACEEVRVGLDEAHPESWVRRTLDREDEREALRREERQSAMHDAGGILAEHRAERGE